MFLIQCKVNSMSNDNLCLKILPEWIYESLPAAPLTEVPQSSENRHETRYLQSDHVSVCKGQAHGTEAHGLNRDLATDVQLQDVILSQAA